MDQKIRQSQTSNRLLKLCRQLISGVVRIVPSGKISDLLVWPISKRLFASGYSEVVSVDTNIRMRLYGDMADMVNKSLLFTSGYKRLAWEPVTARLVKHLAPHIHTAVVAGSHLGYYPLILGANNPNATIYAFEPSPLNYERFVGNISLNGLQKIEPQPLALGDSEGEADMFFDFGQSSFLESSRAHAGSGKVTITTLTRFFEGRATKPDLMVFDAEGYEPHILRGGVSTIRESTPDIIFEINPHILTSENINTDESVRLLTEFGYNFFVIKDNYFSDLSYPANPELKLVPFDAYVLTDEPFINIFATVDPQKINTFI